MPVDLKDNAAVPPLPHDHVIFTDLDGVEGVLVDLNTKQYYQLNETACVIWRGLAKGTTIPNIARQMTELYDVAIERAEASVETAVRALVAQQLLNPKTR